MTKKVPAASSLVHKRRCRFLSILVLVAAVGTTARAAQVQLVQADRWRTRAESQGNLHGTLPAARGGIFDRHGRPLAVSTEEFDAFYAPAESRDAARDVETIVRIAELGSRAAARLTKAETGWSPIGRVDGRVRAGLEEAVSSGVHFRAVVTRVYPEGGIARSLLGSVDETGSGQSGLELLFDSQLVGTEGEVNWRRDARGELYPVPEAERSLPRPGGDVFLTIDLELQEIAEQALARALAETGASGGDVLMADPRTGELLAVASVREDRKFGIPAFTDPYEPGSTVKPFLIATLLQENRASLDDRVGVENGEWRTAHRTIRDVHGYDSLSVAEVLLHSSNIGAAKLAGRLERGLQYSYLRDFGFGTPTGVRVPSESAGLLRRPASWSAVSQASLAFGYELLLTSVQLVAAYGSLANGGVLMRPTLVREIRDFNGDFTWRSNPESVRRVVDRDVASKVTEVLTWVVSEEGTGRRAALETLSIAGKTGTARIASNGGYDERRYAASFVGFAPAENPRLVILTKLEDPQGQYYGGGIAAPVSRRVLQAMLAGQDAGLMDGAGPGPGVSPGTSPGSDLDWSRATSSAVERPAPVGSLKADTRPAPVFHLVANDDPVTHGFEAAPDIDSELAEVSVPDVRGLDVRAAVSRLHELGLRVEIHGTDEVRDQVPAAGMTAVRGASVILR